MIIIVKEIFVTFGAKNWFIKLSKNKNRTKNKNKKHYEMFLMEQ